MQQEFTLTIFSENHVGLLNQITTAFTRRSINIESLNTSESALEGIHKFTIVVYSTREQIEKLRGQLEKKIDVLKVFVFTTDEIIHQELALYKVPTEALLSGNEIEQLVRSYGARIMEVTPDYTVIQKTGHKSETQELFVKLDKYGVLQFIRSGRVAITKVREELLEKYLKKLRIDNKIKGIETY
ncbi:acetolactate synthase, small subunit [Saccharicrinis carchari]|uniref:Acetolactate synthase small subunit n=1 Tax=Saccharicrinis carchari TaxID=1168039 RepID=A0A521BUW4_SACCC|nr:acetolactate synthase small subunit [Saccharicrinis carchari]SMO50957.1 acetolactate synthase, small subunit [Saccharicrinis carchari]